MQAPSALAEDLASEPHVTPAENTDRNVEALLRKVEQQIVDRHTVSPPSDNAMETWQRVTEEAFPESPKTVQALTEFAIRVRNRSVSELAAGRSTVSLDFAVFADLATSLLGRSDVAPAPTQETRRSSGSLPESGQASITPPPVRSAVPATSENASVGGGANISPTRPPTPTYDRPHAPTEQELAVAAQYATRGDQMLAVKDLSAARRFYEYAAKVGSARAAAALARTYDPAFFPQFGVIGLQPDRALAEAWYRKAASLGDRDAEAMLQNLSTAASK